MNLWIKISLYVAVALLTGLLGKRVADSVYFTKRAELTGKIASHTDFIKGANKESKQATRQRSDFDKLVNRTLGGDRESVDHQLRTRLNRIGKELAITGLTVSTGQIKKLQSPAYKEFSQKGTQKKYRDEVDFHELQGWISGQTTYENALRLVHRIDSEPWIKRIDQVRLQPKDNGSRFAVTVWLTTLFLPGRSPEAPIYEPYDSSSFDQYLALAQSNMFRVPPEPQPNAPEPAQIAQQAPKKFPYQGWMVTGVAIGPDGPEVWLRNPQTGESQRLSVGETFEDLLLVGAAGEEAEFKLKEKHFTVLIGRKLRPNQ